MFGTPITFAPVISEGTVGKVVAVKMNDMFAEEIKSLQLTDTLTSTVELITSSSLVDLMALVNVSSVNGSYCLSSGVLYIFILNSVFAYVDTTTFFLIGTRTGIPVRSLEDQIDIPEKDIELFIKYVIREAAELKGKMVPPSIELDIKELESQMED